MLKHFESYKKLYRLMSTWIMIGAAAAVFIEMWARIYNAMIVFPYYFKGFLMMTVMYACMAGFFIWLFNGSQIGYLRRRNALFSKAMSVLCVNVIFYLTTCLLATFLVPVLGFLILSVVDVIMLTVLSGLFNKIFDGIFPVLKMVLIYGDYNESEIKRMTTGWDGKYKIEKVLSIKKGRHKCIAAINEFDAVVLCDVPVEDRNVIAEYCQDKKIPTYFTPKLSDILFQNAEGLRFFEGRSAGNGLGFIFGEKLTSAQRFSLVGYLKKVYKGNKTSLYEKINDDIDKGNKQFIITANPETLMNGLEINEFDAILLDEQSLVIPDGIGLIKALQLAGYGDYGRIPGVEFAQLLFRMADIKGLKLFLYGASEPVIEKMRQLLAKEYPNAKLVGAVNGYDRDSDEVMQEAALAKPDIIMVALGVPAQEELIARHYARFEKGIFIGVGGSFDVLSGTKKRAPALFLKLNLEWLYRITKEPVRLKRFFHSNVRFIWEVMRIKSIK